MEFKETQSYNVGLVKTDSEEVPVAGLFENL
jgi:hypothetical protein